jgi:hypothetical protein
VLWSPNTQLLYPFENSALDYSGNARHGTSGGSGCVYATRPNAGRYLYFPGTGYVVTPAFGLNGSVVIFACWVQSKLSATAYQNLLGDGTQAGNAGFLYCQRRINTNDLWWLYANGSSAQWENASGFFAAPFEDTWLHLWVICDYLGKRTLFYRDGKLFFASAAMSSPLFPSTSRAKFVGSYDATHFLITNGGLAGVYLATLPTMPTATQILANVNRHMLGLHPIC